MRVIRHSSYIKKSKLLDAFLQGDRNFFKEIKKIKGNNKSPTCNVNGYCDNEDIANLFASEYRALFDTCDYSRFFYEDIN